MNPRFAVRFKKFHVHAGLLFLSLAATVLYSASFSEMGVLGALRLKSIDLLYRSRSASTAPLGSLEKIVIVGLDDDSYTKLNRRWPWGREVLAVLVGRLGLLGPKVVGMDFTFVGKSPSEDPDRLLAAAIQKNREVVLASYFDEAGRYREPLRQIGDAARAVGFVDMDMDRDAVYRRHKLVVPSDNRPEFVYSFSIEVACAYLDVDPADKIAVRQRPAAVLVPAEDAAGSVRIAEAEVDEAGRILLSYRYKPEEFDYLPLWKVLADEVRRDEVEGKIVLVGPVSPIFHDIYNTPLGQMPGVFVNANQIASILAGDYIRTPLRGFTWAPSLLVAAIFTIAFLRLQLVTNFVLLIILGCLLYVSSIRLFAEHNILFEPFPPFFTLLLTYLIVLTYRVTRTLIENISLQRMVATDDLTGLFTHRYLSLRLRKLMESPDPEFCLVMADIDNFKSVNDRYGHEKGNALLAAIARVLKDACRRNDIVARYGGDEFSIVLLNCKEKMAAIIVKKILSGVEQLSVDAPAGAITATLSAGICSNKSNGVDSAESLISCADKALLEAKSIGKNQLLIYASSS